MQTQWGRCRQRQRMQWRRINQSSAIVCTAAGTVYVAGHPTVVRQCNTGAGRGSQGRGCSGGNTLVEMPGEPQTGALVVAEEVVPQSRELLPPLAADRAAALDRAVALARTEVAATLDIPPVAARHRAGV